VTDVAAYEPEPEVVSLAEQIYRQRYAPRVRRVHEAHGPSAAAAAWNFMRKQARRDADQHLRGAHGT
jgi:hypothetical protein